MTERISLHFIISGVQQDDSVISIFFKKKNYLFLVVMSPYCLVGFSLAAESGGPLCSCSVGFLLWWSPLLCSMGSTGPVSLCSCVMWAQQLQASEHRLSSSCTRAQLLLGMRDPPGPGTETMCPALAGRFFSTEPPGKSSILFLKAELTSQRMEGFLCVFFLIVGGGIGKDNSGLCVTVWSL